LSNFNHLAEVDLEFGFGKRRRSGIPFVRVARRHAAAARRSIGARTLAAKPPSGPDWVHEIKHDGYRLIVRRDGKTVRLFTRRGYDWIDRYPAIAAAAAKLRVKSFTLHREAVVTGEGGRRVR
jgi:ATP-dependent DNA ligase